MKCFLKGFTDMEVKSDGKRVKTKLAKLKSWMIEHWHDKLDVIFKHFNDVLRGYYHYYAVTCNLQMVRLFRHRVIDIIFKWLNRRSQKKTSIYSYQNRTIFAMRPHSVFMFCQL